MVTAVDTNVFLDVFLNDPQYGSASFAALTKAFSSGDVVVGEVVWSETGAVFQDEQSFLAAMDKLGVRFVPMPKEAATKAADMWRLARANRTPPQHNLKPHTESPKRQRRLNRPHNPLVRRFRVEPSSFTTCHSPASSTSSFFASEFPC